MAPTQYGPGGGPICDDRHVPHIHDYDDNIECTNTGPNMLTTNFRAPGNLLFRGMLHYGQGSCAQTNLAGQAVVPQLAPQLPNHVGNFSVCGNCIEDTEDKQWYTDALRMIGGAPKDSGETKFTRNFLTRLCRRCEAREQLLCHAVAGNVAMAVPMLLPATANAMWAWPVNQCRCRREFEDRRLCTEHRRAQLEVVRRRLYRTRNLNRQWLHETARNPGNGALCTSAPLRRSERIHYRAHKILRSCSCGREVTRQVPRVYQCMACSGIVHVVVLGPAPAAPIPAWMMFNRTMFPAMFAMRRGRSAIQV